MASSNSPPLQRPARWLIGIAASPREYETFLRIRDLDVGPWMPIVHKQRRAGRNRLRDVVEPLARPYFFVPSTLSDQEYHDVLHTRGVIGFLKFRGRPAVCRDAELNRFRREEQRLEQLRQKRIAESGQGRHYMIGEQVRITIGFSLVEASVHSIDDRGRVEVRLTEGTLFGREIVPVDMMHIRPAP